jgi:hypothetical protein
MSENGMLRTVAGPAKSGLGSLPERERERETERESACVQIYVLNSNVHYYSTTEKRSPQFCE